MPDHQEPFHLDIAEIDATYEVRIVAHADGSVRVLIPALGFAEVEGPTRHGALAAAAAFIVERHGK